MIEFLLNKNIAQHEFLQCEVENDGKKAWLFRLSDKLTVHL